MGYRISWLAVHEMTADRLLASLEMSDSGELDEANEAAFSVARLPNGWSVPWANDEHYADHHRAAELSRRGAHVIAVRVNETCMHATVSAFEQGRRRWSVHHEGDERIDFLDMDGDLPPQVRAIENEARARQAAEDADRAEVDWLFEIPLEVARSICGYKHDQAQFDWGEPSFTAVVSRPILSSSNERTFGFFGRFFGRTLRCN